MESRKYIFYAGDSTAAQKKDCYYPETGIGQMLPLFFNENVTIHNHAINGRSTKSFIDEGRLERIDKEIREGDYLFIQFGHNDCSNAQGYLEDRYVPLGKPNAKGIYPVTCSGNAAPYES
ncbi:MAG: hypothetical protein MJ124_05510, partial [Lachnospiraceae bacterium]|nr:hypothetical protein [Lachnospiraceae bacterium]